MPAPSDPTDRLISPPGYFPSRRAEQRGEEQAAKLVLCRGIPTSRLPFPCSLGMVLRPKRNRRRLPPRSIRQCQLSRFPQKLDLNKVSRVSKHNEEFARSGRTDRQSDAHVVQIQGLCTEICLGLRFVLRNSFLLLPNFSASS